MTAESDESGEANQHYELKATYTEDEIADLGEFGIEGLAEFLADHNLGHFERVLDREVREDYRLYTSVTCEDDAEDDGNDGLNLQSPGVARGVELQELPGKIQRQPRQSLTGEDDV